MVSITSIKYKVKKILTILELLSLMKTRLEALAKIFVFRRIANKQQPLKTIWIITSKSSTGKLYFKVFIIWIVYITCKKVTIDKKSSGKYDLSKMESILSKQAIFIKTKLYTSKQLSLIFYS